MKVWKVTIKAKRQFQLSDDRWSYTYYGIAKTANVAINQVKNAAQKEFYCIDIVLVECLGELDFCTKR